MGSNQNIPAGGTANGASSTAVLTDGQIVLGDGGVRGVKTNGDVIADFLPVDGSSAMTGELNLGANSIGSTKQTYTGTGTINIDFTKGGHHYFTHGAGDVTFTFTAPAGDCNFTFWTKQDGVGGRGITWPTVLSAGGVAPTNSTGANEIDMWGLIREGTNWHLVLASANES